MVGVGGYQSLISVYLHSTVVLLMAKVNIKALKASAVFTFYCSSINGPSALLIVNPLDYIYILL
mgnify:CR=1 FL=1